MVANIFFHWNFHFLASVEPLVFKLGTQVGLATEECAISSSKLILRFISIKGDNLGEWQLKRLFTISFICSRRLDGLV